jgi:DNA-binding transcriptional MerR regulator
VKFAVNLRLPRLLAAAIAPVGHQLRPQLPLLISNHPATIRECALQGADAATKISRGAPRHKQVTRCPALARGVSALMSRSCNDSTDLVSIGELAKAAGVSNRTIRYYEELGILPEPRRSPGGTRKYPREYSGYIAAALALKDLGFRLEEVKPLARLAAGRSVSPGQRDAAARIVEDKIEVLARQVTVLRRLYDSVRAPDAELPVSAVLGSAGGRAELSVVSAIPDDGAA